MRMLSDINFPVAITKMSGTGNDFIIIDNRLGIVPHDVQSELARRVCRRKFSAGADGLILIEESEQFDFRWQFYNADGSNAEMCGNGARCAARFAFSNKIAAAKMKFETTAGLIEAEMVGDSVKIKLTSPEDLIFDQKLTLDSDEKTVHSINTGVPHVVFFVDDIKNCPVLEWGKIIRNHSLYQPAGTNVNFVQQLGETLHVRTYERGVEGETLACGTGAVASALIAAMTRQASSPQAITTSGGEILTIHFDVNNATNKVNEAYLEGPANFIYSGVLHAEAV